MAVEVLIFGGAIDGDLPLDPAHAAYKGGQPALITATGVNVTLLPATYIGILKNDSVDDDRQGPQVNDTAAPGTSTSVIIGANKLRVTQAAAADVFLFPGTAGAWAEGQEIFISVAGKLDNAAAAGGDPSIGKVLRAPASATDDLHMQQYPTTKKL